jgi:hypothetical protein
VDRGALVEVQTVVDHNAVGGDAYVGAGGAADTDHKPALAGAGAAHPSRQNKAYNLAGWQEMVVQAHYDARAEEGVRD